MAKVLTWLIVVPLAIVVIAFAIANRHWVELRLDPLPYTFEVPLFTLVFTGIVVGLCVGGFAAWLKAGRWRRLARQEHRLATQLSHDLETSRAAASAENGEGRSLTKVA